MNDAAEGASPGGGVAASAAGGPRYAFALHSDEIMAVTFLVALLAAAWLTEGNSYESLKSTRLAFFTVVGLLVCSFGALVVGGRRGSTERIALIGRHWWSIVLGVLAYETLKHLHANRITVALGIEPKDLLMLRIDEILFGAALPLKMQWMVSDALTAILENVYIHGYYAAPIGTLAYLYFFRRNDAAFLDVRRALLMALFGGYLMYILIPVAGPQFYIGDLYTVPLEGSAAIRKLTWNVLRYSWDCFPSLHTAVPWAVTIVAWRSLGRVARTALVINASGCTLAAVYLRFHYGIDIIAGLAWAALVAYTVLRSPSRAYDVVLAVSDVGRRRARAAVLGVAFVVTGGVGLLLEQVLEKLVGTIIGSSLTASAVVLSVYFAGLAIGGFVAGRRGFRRPLLTYAALEGFVGVWALLIYLFFDPIHAASVSLFQGGATSPIALQLIRLAVAAAWILPPTVAMGMSFPCVVGALKTNAYGEPRRTMVLFYGLNLVGAIAATFIGAYEILPNVGLGGALLVCTLAELLVFMAVASLREPTAAVSAQPPPEAAVDAPAPPLVAFPARKFRMDDAAVFGLAFLSGFVFFAFEVLAALLIGAVAGTSTYAFATMLAIVLIGLLLGSLAVAFMGRRGGALPEWVLVAALLASAAGLLRVLTHAPDVPFIFLRWGAGLTDFADGELLRFLASAWLLLPAAMFTGLLFPLIFRMPWFDESRRERLAGHVGAANAIGCFTGALAGAYVLVMRLGSQASLYLLVTLTLSLAMLLSVVAVLRLVRVRPIRRGSLVLHGVLLGAGAIYLAAASGAPAWDWRAVTSGLNVYFSPRHTTPESEILFVQEDPHVGIVTVTLNPGIARSKGVPYRTLMTNGKFEGNDSYEMPAQIGFAMVPLLHAPRFDTACVIGLGTGHTAEVVSDAGFGRVDVVEISPAILNAARTTLADVNGGVLDRASTRVVVDDGRNYLLRTRERYDLITIEISSIWFQGATNLYAKEFYDAASDRLTEGGVLQQWIQIHHLTHRELASVLRTVAHAFPYAEFWYVGGQGIILASDSPITLRPENRDRLASAPSMGRHRDILARWGYPEVGELERWRLLTEPDFARLAWWASSNGVPVNRDLNRWLEYRTPRYNLSRVDHVSANLRFLLMFVPPEEVGERSRFLRR